MAAKTILQKKGVTLIEPETISIAEDVNTGNISEGAVIHPGCRLGGSELSIARECVIGKEGPATVTTASWEPVYIWPAATSRNLLSWMDSKPAADHMCDPAVFLKRNPQSHTA